MTKAAKKKKVMPKDNMGLVQRKLTWVFGTIRVMTILAQQPTIGTAELLFLAHSNGRKDNSERALSKLYSYGRVPGVSPTSPTQMQLETRYNSTPDKAT